MIRSELRDEIAREVRGYGKNRAFSTTTPTDIADRILSIAHLKEALDFYSACQSAFEVNGEFKVTKEALRGKGGVSASL